MTSPETPSGLATSSGTQAGALRPTLRRPLMTMLLLSIAAGLLAPIWTVRYPPLVDYPFHLATAFVLAHIKDPVFHFHEFYASDWNTQPYLAMYAVLVGLQRIASIYAAGRLLLSLCVLSVPAGAWFFLRQANPGEESLAYWSLLISHNLFYFLYGFLNFQLGFALSLLILGVWLRYLERPRWLTWCLLLVLTTGLYFTHLQVFGIAGFVVTAYCLLSRRRIRDTLFSWALFVPGLLLYLHAMVGMRVRHGLQFRGVGGKLIGLVVVVLGYSPPLDFLTLLVVGGALCWARYNPEFKWNRTWLGTVGLLFALYWIFPAAYGVGMNADRRLLPFVAVLGLAAVRIGQTRGRELAKVAVLLFFLRAGVLEWHFVSLQPHLAKLAASFSAIPKDARVLPLVDWAGGAPSVEREFWAYGVIQRGWFTPCIFHDPGVEPFQVRLQTYNPYGPAFGNLEPPDWKRIETDYDYVWAYRVPQFSSALSSEGKVVFESENLQVFQIRRASGSQPQGP